MIRTAWKFRQTIAPAAVAALVAASLLASLAFAAGPQAEEKAKAEKTEKSEKASRDDGALVKLRIEVVAGENEGPVDNASVYVKFQKERTLAKDQKIEMNTKTNRNGVALVPAIPRGKILVQVIASGWKTFGQWYDVDKDVQTIRIKLQKPPRWY